MAFSEVNGREIADEDATERMEQFLAARMAAADHGCLAIKEPLVYNAFLSFHVISMQRINFLHGCFWWQLVTLFLTIDIFAMPQDVEALVDVREAVRALATVLGVDGTRSATLIIVLGTQEERGADN